MCVINHNWSATKQRPHPQSVAEISRHSVLSGTGFDNARHRLGLATRTQISVCKSPFPSAGTAVSLFCAKTVQQRQLLPREVETWLPVALIWKRSKPDPVKRPVRTARTTACRFNGTQYCSTEPVLLILPYIHVCNQGPNVKCWEWYSMV